MKIIFGSVIYPNAVQYTSDFLCSLNGQSYKNFSLLLINDGVSKDVLNCLLKGYNNEYEIVEYPDKKSPVELRIKLLVEAKLRKCDYLIMGDIDDFFSENRIEKSLLKFCEKKSIGFVYNKLLLIDGRDCMPEFPESIKSIRGILEYNFLGLSNTALNLQHIDKKFIYDLSKCKSFVFDWYFFSRLILRGEMGEIVPDVITFYRIHENNYAGIPKMTQKMVDKEIFIKREHYRTLLPYNDCFKSLLNIYDNEEFEMNNQDKYYWWNLTRRKKYEVRGD